MKCSFSGKEIPMGTGKMYVKKDGTILWFSSLKAQKNMLQLKRKANKIRWTEDSKLAKTARLAALKHEEEAKKNSPKSDKESDKESKKTSKPKVSKKSSK